MKKVIDLSGFKFNRLRVISRDFEITDKGNKIFWKCKCDCGNFVTVSGNGLKSGISKSCGCYKKEIIKKTKNSKHNKWEFEGSIAIGVTSSGDKFIIDAEDFDRVKDFCWRINKNGYVVANMKSGTNKTIIMHRIIMKAKKDDIIDHINWNKKNNLKSNLRFATKSENNVNIKKRKDNTSGYTGVKNNNGKWKSQISFNGKRIHLGTFDKFEDAVIARKNYEDRIHKTFNGEINRKDFHMEEAQSEETLDKEV